MFSEGVNGRHNYRVFFDLTIFNSTHILVLGKEKSISFQHVGKEILKAENLLLFTEKALSSQKYHYSNTCKIKANIAFIITTINSLNRSLINCNLLQVEDED